MTEDSNPQEPRSPETAMRPAFLTLDLDPVDAAGRFKPVFRLRTDDPEGQSSPDVSVGPDNLLDFASHKGRVRVKIRITRRNWQWDEFTRGVFVKFADDKGGRETEVDPSLHHQIVKVDFDPADAGVLSFIYRNKIKDKDDPSKLHKQSAWGFMLKDGAMSYPVDPIISNGGNPSEEGQLTDPP